MIGRAAFIGLLTLYPFIVYFGIRILPATFFAILLAVLVALRLTIVKPEERRMVLPVMLLLLVYAIGAAIIGRTQALLYYPVLVNVLLCTMFTLSLWSGEPLLLRIVRSRGISISEHGARYISRLTAVWACFFAINGLIAFWTTTTTLRIWTLYNGLVSYLLIGTLVLGEWRYRKYYKRTHRVSNH